jgi:hypothetical protein
VEIRTGSLTFPSEHDTGPRTTFAVFNFTKSVSQAVAALAGTGFGFSQPHGDHHLGQVNVSLSTAWDDDVVTVTGTFGVRDWSNNFDDYYDGTIQFVLLAELDEASIPSNLSITGVEYNQAIQFFRSKLDPAIARPDNSIPMIAMKNTSLRVYVDTQSDPTRPIISTISGRLEFRLPGSSTWNTADPLNQNIQPKLDSSINRANKDDTLNFFIPGVLCVGNVDFRVRVFDSNHPNQPGYTSGQFQNTLKFTQVAPLRVYGIGIHYVGKDKDIAAPSYASLRDTLLRVNDLFPIGLLSITGFEVIDYDGDFDDMSGDKCGSGWDGLLRKLHEMQGDNDDVYFGLIDRSVKDTDTAYGGCGDGGVASSFVRSNDDEFTGAHETAHAFGRRHAPCGDSPLGYPKNVDPNYPMYDALPSASIGECGTDFNTVKDPASVKDFMSYCHPVWVSPYTYEGLRQHFPASQSSASERAQSIQPPERLSTPSQHLFLNFRIYSNRKIEVFPSFHYISLPTVKSGDWTPYVIELRDRHNHPLHSQRVWLTDPYTDLDSASVDFYKPIPFSERTARVVFICSNKEDCERKELLSIDVPEDSPKVRITYPSKVSEQLSGKVGVTWEAHFHDKGLNYLLRYSNDGGSTWRAVAPSLQVTQYIVDFDLLPGGEKCQLQVLATEGIRTGMAVSEFFSVPRHPRATTIIKPQSGTTITAGQKVTLFGDSYSPDTGSAHPSELKWYSDIEGLLGSGLTIYNIVLRPGLHKISLQTNNGLGGESVESIQIEVKTSASHKHTSLTHPGHTSKNHDSGKMSYRQSGGD